MDRTPKPWLVRVTRPNGSITFKGPYTTQRKASNEASAWLGVEGHVAGVIDLDENPDATEWAAQFKAWKKWIRSITAPNGIQSGEQFFPEVVQPSHAEVLDMLKEMK